jgi:hypothetical protein
MGILVALTPCLDMLLVCAALRSGSGLRVCHASYLLRGVSAEAAPLPRDG